MGIASSIWSNSPSGNFRETGRLDEDLETASAELYVFSHINLGEISANRISKYIERVRKVSAEEVNIIFLGNFYMPGADLVIKKTAVSLADRYGEVYLIPGEKEWNILGAEGIRKFDEQLDEGDGKKYDLLIPDNACGEVETKEITDKATLLAVDSEWFLQDWSKIHGINEDCEVKDRDDFLFFLDEEISGLKEKLALLFVYHPPYRYDRRGGYERLTDQLFPLAEYFPWAYLPLPLLGTGIQQSEAYLRGPSWATHPYYQKLTTKIKHLAKFQKKLIVISSDAHHLMHMYENECHMLNVYSGEETKPFNKHLPGFADHRSGFLKIGINNQEAKLSFHTLDDEGTEIYQEHYRIPEVIEDEIRFDTVTTVDEFPETVTRPIMRKGEGMRPDATWFWGRLNTDLYYEPIEAAVLDLNREVGGLKPYRIGGGHQSISLRLEDSQGRKYATRSVIKSPNALLAPPFNFSFLETIFEFYFTAANPFGFLAMYPMESALGLKSAESQLRFLPYQKGLSPYNDETGDQFVLFRKRIDDSWIEEGTFGQVEDFEGSHDLLKEYYENDATIDRQAYLKARLLDFLVNDWDRHEDQWKWSKKDDPARPNLNLYTPIPRDRDQVFAEHNGFLLSFLRQYTPSLFAMRPFHSKITRKDINRSVRKTAVLDNHVLTGIPKETWDSISRWSQEKITDDVIANSVNRLPPGLNEDRKKHIQRVLTSRRDQMHKYGLLYYEAIHERPFIFASQDADSIIIEANQTETRIIIRSQDDDDDWYTKFENHFQNRDVREITIFGKEGDDVFLMNGGYGKTPKVRLIGGLGTDQYLDELVKRPAKFIMVEGSIDESNDDVKIRRSINENRKAESFSKNDVIKPYAFYVPKLAYNRDDGVFFGTDVTFNRPGFKRKVSHTLGIQLSSKPRSSSFEYAYRNENNLKSRDFLLDLFVSGPQYVYNFFGSGNRSTIDFSKERAFYYVREKSAKLSSGWIWHLNELLEFTARVNFDRLAIEKVENRFVSTPGVVAEDVFSNQYFGGVTIALAAENMNSRLRPTNGTSIHIQASYLDHLSSKKRDYFRLDAGYEMYKSLDLSERFVYSTHLFGAHVTGDPFFYHLPTIGGNDNLRGYRNNRFQGHTAFYHNNNLHFRLFDRFGKGVLPTSLGLTLSFDHGRVWSRDELGSEKDWRTTFGAGLWLSPFDRINLSVGTFKADEELEIRFKIGWLF